MIKPISFTGASCGHSVLLSKSRGQYTNHTTLKCSENCTHNLHTLWCIISLHVRLIHISHNAQNCPMVSQKHSIIVILEAWVTLSATSKRLSYIEMRNVWRPSQHLELSRVPETIPEQFFALRRSIFTGWKSPMPSGNSAAVEKCDRWSATIFRHVMHDKGTWGVSQQNIACLFLTMYLAGHGSYSQQAVMRYVSTRPLSYPSLRFWAVCAKVAAVWQGFAPQALQWAF